MGPGMDDLDEYRGFADQPAPVRRKNAPRSTRKMPRKPTSHRRNTRTRINFVELADGLRAAGKSAFADLTVSQIVSTFNGLGTGDTLSFSSSLPGTGERRFSAPGGLDYTNFAAAYQSGANGTSLTPSSFNSFCIEPNVPTVAASGTARLNYSGGNSSRTDSDGKAVSVGTALLYQQYATGAFNSSLYNYANTAQRTADSDMLTRTLRYLMAPQSEPPLSWTNNKYLAYLLTINSNQDYWTGVYDPSRRYNEIGDFAVFVMNIRNTSGTPSQDFLYIARVDYSNGGQVPEPATMLLWSIGGIGLVGTWARQRRMKKLTVV